MRRESRVEKAFSATGGPEEYWQLHQLTTAVETNVQHREELLAALESPRQLTGCSARQSTLQYRRSSLRARSYRDTISRSLKSIHSSMGLV